MIPGAIVIDLETAPIDGADVFLEEPSAPSNYKDEAKIAAYVADAKQKAVERCGLDPDLGRIVCLGWMLEGRDHEPVTWICRDEPSERLALIALWREVVLPNGAHRKIITFNGNAFDLPYLLRRSQYLRVLYPHLNIDRYRTPHIDLCARLSFNGVLKAHSLQFYAKRFELPGDPDPVQGCDIAALVKDGSDVSWRAIENHCKSDVRTTYELAARLCYVDYDEDREMQAITDAVGF